MAKKKQHKSTIGIVLYSVPRYSETFFRNKIKGLQENGFEVILFVDYFNKDDINFPCKIVAASVFNEGKLKTIINSLFALLKAVFVNPKRSLKLFQLDKKDGVALKKRVKNLILNQFFLNENIDWLHFGFGMLAIDRENVAQVMNAKMAVSFRGFDLYLSPLRHKDCYKSLFTKKVKYHVLSQEMKQTLIDYEISKDTIKVITPAIDVTFFQTQNKNREDSAVIQLVSVARLHWKKGLEYSLEALKCLKLAGVKFQYTIIGEGAQLERLVFAAHQLEIEENVTFTGALSHDDVKSQLEQADIYLQYSIQEGFCNAVIEAQAMGLLTVVSDAEGLSENVLNNETGWVVPKRSPELLAHKIIEVINLSPEEKNKIRVRAIARVKEEFNLKKQKQAFVDFYKKD
ncbi:glycosyltransferase family 4 protein [Lacinutrix iliipiscaria]|uniref:Glycosyltransferase family 4 protein n=1 Tax=Lacinutrix iliipiscaria TaxID=1230532 RepID=A0ABW5WMA6_9FLAO